MPVLDALREGVVDVPVIIGTYAHTRVIYCVRIYHDHHQPPTPSSPKHTHAGNMGQEVDAWPAAEVGGLSAPEWRVFLRRWFWGKGWGEAAAVEVADGLERLYKNESERDPQVRY